MTSPASISGVDQHPFADGQAFGLHRAEAGVLQRRHDPLGNGPDMPVRPARGNHHLIGERGFAVHIDGDDLLGLGILERGEDRAKR